MPTIYSQLAKAAKPIVAHYLNDVKVHDLAACRKFKTGNTALWCCYEHGSHFIWVNGPGETKIDAEELRATRASLDWFNAIQKQKPRIQWHLLESTDAQQGHFEKCSPDFARDLLTRRLEALQRHLAGKEAA